MVLDLNLPRVSGVDVLRRVKGDRVRTIPVVVFSTSRADVDISVAYACGADAYVVKPVDLHRMAVVCDIESTGPASSGCPDGGAGPVLLIGGIVHASRSSGRRPGWVEGWPAGWGGGGRT